MQPLHQFVHFLTLSHYLFFVLFFFYQIFAFAERKRDSDLQSKLAPAKEFTDEATLVCLEVNR